ncbi:hypothetical protein KN400_3502 [Geobacter sulfurreducens KN400]|nr:hypothetical protein KN400_3502 [Geobacter sulfurreducens KN400]
MCRTAFSDSAPVPARAGIDRQVALPRCYSLDFLPAVTIPRLLSGPQGQRNEGV